MSPQPKTLKELLAEGNLELRSLEEIEANAGRDDAATERWMEMTRSAAQAEPRRPGRPSASQPRRATLVRGVRLEASLWSRLDELSDLLGCSTNRFIEEAVAERVRLEGMSTLCTQEGPPAEG